MIYKVLRFLGAIIVAYIFALLNDLMNLAFFRGACDFFNDITWKSWLSFDTLRGFILPIIWAILWLVGWGLWWLVKGVKWITILPIIYFIVRLIDDFYLLFINPSAIIDMEHGFWYYTGAVITFIEILVCYGICTVALFQKQLD